MTDEEKKAIESFKEENNNDLSRFDDFNSYTQFKVKRDKIIIDLIEKQSKEIEELKDKNKSLENELIVYKIYTKQDDLKDFDLFLKQNYVSKKESEQKEKEAYNFGYRNGCNDTSKFNDKTFISKDKIKAKIDEVCESTIEESNVDILYSLLEKE